MNVYRSVSREQVELYLYKVTYGLLLNIINEEAADEPLSEGDKFFIAHFYKYVFVGLMLVWIRGDMKEDPKEIVDHLSLLMQGKFSRALKAYRAGKTKQIRQFDKFPNRNAVVI